MTFVRMISNVFASNEFWRLGKRHRPRPVCLFASFNNLELPVMRLNDGVSEKKRKYASHFDSQTKNEMKWNGAECWSKRMSDMMLRSSSFEKEWKSVPCWWFGVSMAFTLYRMRYWNQFISFSSLPLFMAFTYLPIALFSFCPFFIQLRIQGDKLFFMECVWHYFASSEPKIMDNFNKSGKKWSIY